ncbi:MAG: efflux RND transporter periplasmic adaptor subunit [Bacteroidales bacterium]|jgi:cobalt-zinc-cadmium efflux system membrane fusion protein|nr:efflux RND transporter periplasmic adaptor subunit [Bacteroidales bacterium]
MKYIIYVLVFSIATMSCNTKVADIQEEEHGHGDVKLYLTEYSDQFEIFAEADPFIVGETTNILAHFSYLSDFKPLTKGSITISLIIGTNGIKQIIEEPVKPGIYQFALQPKVKGVGKLIFDIKNDKGDHKVVIENIVVYEDVHDAIRKAEEEVIDKINAISFTKEQSWKIDFETVLPLKVQFGKVIKTTAQILSDQSNESLVTAKTNGVVKFHNNILNGNVVRIGETLLGISGNGLANDNLNVQFIEGKNNYNLAKADYDRKLALSQNKIVSEKEMESAKAEFENAKAVYDNLKNNFNSNGQIVVSPQKGVIKHVYVSNGQYVEAGTSLFSVANNDKLIVKAEVQQKDYPLLSSIVSANIKSSTNKKIYSLDELNGKLLSFGKNIEEDEGYLIPVNFQIENNNEFLSGSFVEVFIKTKTNQKALIVSNNALIEEYGNFFLFVQLTPELFEKREVKIGVSDGLNTEIIMGISDSERIVSKGAIIVKLAAVSNSLDPHAGHVH